MHPLVYKISFTLLMLILLGGFYTYQDFCYTINQTILHYEAQIQDILWQIHLKEKSKKDVMAQVLDLYDKNDPKFKTFETLVKEGNVKALFDFVLVNNNSLLANEKFILLKNHIISIEEDIKLMQLFLNRLKWDYKIYASNIWTKLYLKEKPIEF